MSSKIFLILTAILIFSFIEMSVANNYYFSSVNGNDSNSGATEDSPKESLNAIKSALSSVQPGDTIFLERGSIWYQSYITITGKEGTAESPIVITAYGSGENPILSGQKILSNPTQDGNIYTFTDSQLPFIIFTEKSFGRRFPGYITIGGKPYLPSRYPNKGYLTSSSSNRISVTDNNRSWTENQWIDGWAAVKSVKWEWSVVRITGNTANKLNTTEHVTVPFGPKPYFIFNAYDAMDQNGEWFSKESSLSVYWTEGTLPEVKASTVDRILSLSNTDYLYVSNIDLVGANIACVRIKNSDYNKFENCRMIGSGQFGVFIYGSFDTENNQVTRCELADCGSAAIYTRYAKGGIFTNNYIHRIGINEGYQNIYDNTTCDGAYAIVVWNSSEHEGFYPIVKQNFLDSVSGGLTNHYNGYLFSMRENLVRNYGMGDLSDLGGFYSTTDTYSLTNKKRISKNFFLDVHEPDSSSQINFNSDSYIHAMYTDQDIYGVKCDSNTIENADIAVNTNGGVGRTFNYNNILKSGVHHNGVFRNSYLLPLMSGSPANSDSFMYNNVVLDKNYVGYAFFRVAGSYGCALPKNGSIDYNKWFDPTGQAGSIASIYNGYSLQYSFAFPQWQSYSEECDGNTNNPGANSSYNNTAYEEVRMFKNWSATERTFYISAEYVDVDGNPVTDSVSVEAFFSKILFKTSGTETCSDLYIDSTLVPTPVAVAPAELVVSSRALSKLENNVKYYPVPVKDHLVLENLPERSKIEIYDIIGHKVFSQNQVFEKQCVVDMQSFKKGIYVFKIIDSDATILQTFKILKE